MFEIYETKVATFSALTDAEQEKLNAAIKYLGPSREPLSEPMRRMVLRDCVEGLRSANLLEKVNTVSFFDGVESRWTTLRARDYIEPSTWWQRFWRWVRNVESIEVLDYPPNRARRLK